LARDLGNAEGRGIKGRFGHPGMSENVTGKQISTNRNFSVDGEKLRHDFYFFEPARTSPSFHHDPIDYLSNVARHDPTAMGESVVIDAMTVWPMKDGREIEVEVGWGGDYYYPEGIPDDIAVNADGRPLESLTPLPALRPVRLYFVDMVNEGALTPDGMFSSDAQSIFNGRANEYAFELFDLVDRWRKQFNIPLDRLETKVDELLTKYIATRGETTHKEQLSMAAKRRAATRKSLEEGQSQAAPVEAENDAALESDEETESDDSNVDETIAASAEALDSLEADDEGEEDEEQTTLAELAADIDELRTIALDNARLIERLVQSFSKQDARMSAFSDLLDRDIKATVALKEKVSAMGRDVKRIDGERIVNRRFRQQPGRADALETAFEDEPVQEDDPFAALSFSRQPKHTTERKREADPNYVAPDDFSPLAALKRQAALSRQVTAAGKGGVS